MPVTAIACEPPAAVTPPHGVVTSITPETAPILHCEARHAASVNLDVGSDRVPV